MLASEFTSKNPGQEDKILRNMVFEVIGEGNSATECSVTLLPSIQNGKTAWVYFMLGLTVFPLIK